MQSRPWPQVPELTAQVARAVAARGPYPPAMWGAADVVAPYSGIGGVLEEAAATPQR